MKAEQVRNMRFTAKINQIGTGTNFLIRSGLNDYHFPRGIVYMNQ